MRIKELTEVSSEEAASIFRSEAVKKVVDSGLKRCRIRLPQREIEASQVFEVERENRKTSENKRLTETEESVEFAPRLRRKNQPTAL
ncbi:hypothetical protein NVV94_09755 [Pseudomonas sp. LS1212]|uniref:hypothetical protein n=1 Tax=Pseudomonas sp. LS1212 TaxID=2972478 RepID=UPI00215CCAC3|nr:hypothetical protein [Pseudomonas sp. LS1212]UVJ44773.1 hypothetical protein NVV94_04030 [Pseudomonas sp. LS1212]UVJ45799.1 hypothetical protein NVV94_09755 [Pseudomonas sp. LS1212]